MMTADAQTDRELLVSFLEQRDEEAFRALVRRYELLVLSVCTRMLRDEHGARDAAQAVFLILAQKGRTLDLERPLGPWLHRVACAVAASARRNGAARRRREERAVRESRPERSAEDLDGLREALDGELDGLPEKYRRPLILFHLEQKTLEETARELGSPIGTVGAWLSRGRMLLRDRMVRRGAGALSGAALGAWLAGLSSAQELEGQFARLTARAAVGGGSPTPAGAIMKGAFKMAWIPRLKVAAALFVATGAFLGAGSLISLRSPQSSEASARTIPPQAGPAGRPAAAELPPSVLSFEPFVPVESPFPPTSDLIGHWKFDDEKGSSSAADATGKANGRVSSGATFAEGRLGGALHCDGAGGHVEIPSTDELDKVQDESYSIAAWFKPDDVPPGKESDNRANYGIVMKTGWHLGLYYTNEKKFTMCHWLAGEKPEEPAWVGTGAWDEEYEPGQWYHLVGTVDRTAGKISIYVNGESKNSADFQANAAPRQYGKTTWKVGIGNPGAKEWSWPAKGSIDDVRIYARALGAAEVKALYEGK